MSPSSVFTKIRAKKEKIVVVGLGYVGLPLALELSTKFDVTGFDISESKIKMLKKGKDPSFELSDKEMKRSKIAYTSDPSALSEAVFIIVTVPTPISENKQPDLFPVVSACETVGLNLKKGATVVFESTV
ncbi:MAG: nucleotide sugar dehydrogenase, partial [Fibrobacterota bacterium]